MLISLFDESGVFDRLGDCSLFRSRANRPGLKRGPFNARSDQDRSSQSQLRLRKRPKGACVGSRCPRQAAMGSEVPAAAERVRQPRLRPDRRTVRQLRLCLKLIATFSRSYLGIIGKPLERGGDRFEKPLRPRGPSHGEERRQGATGANLLGMWGADDTLRDPAENLRATAAHHLPMRSLRRHIDRRCAARIGKLANKNPTARDRGGLHAPYASRGGRIQAE